MNVRGAPLIAIVAALGLGVDMSAKAAAGVFGTGAAAAAEAWVKEAAEYLKTSRPTAVNLFTAMDQMVALAGEVCVCVVVFCFFGWWYVYVDV